MKNKITPIKKNRIFIASTILLLTISSLLLSTIITKNTSFHIGTSILAGIAITVIGLSLQEWSVHRILISSPSQECSYETYLYDSSYRTLSSWKVWIDRDSNPQRKRLHAFQANKPPSVKCVILYKAWDYIPLYGIVLSLEWAQIGYKPIPLN